MRTKRDEKDKLIVSLQKRIAELEAEIKEIRRPDTVLIDDLRAKISNHTDEIARRRDALREILDDAESVIDSSDRAVEALAEAVDALSEHL